MNTNLFNVVQAVVYGCALADAVGEGTEFRIKKDIENYVYQGHLYTDDTCQLLVIMDTFIETKGKYDTLVFTKRLRNWVQHGYSKLGQTFGEGCGNTVGRVIRGHEFLTNPYKVAEEFAKLTGLSANGSIMRTAILGCVPLDKLTVLTWAEQIGAVTHGDERCKIAVCMVTSMFYDLVNGINDDEIYNNAFMCIPPESQYREEILRHCMVENLSDLDLNKCIGYCLKCLGVFLWGWRNRQRKWKDVILDIVLEGGDADTNAINVGGFLCLYNILRKGVTDVLPSEWWDIMPGKEFLDEKIRDFVYSFNAASM